MPLETYIPAAMTIVLALGFVGLLCAMAMILGPKRTSAVKSLPFEGGNDPIGSPRARVSVRFYQVAILFLVFDVEIAFMYPWAINFRALTTDAPGGPSLFGLWEMLLFVLVLATALAYAWRKKAIAWD